jgi:FMN reductase
MEFSVRSLRGWAVPYVVPVSQAMHALADSGDVQDDGVRLQLGTLGQEVVRVAQRFAQDPALHRQAGCEEAADRVVQAV